MDGTQTREGFILLAQEHRFRLVDDAGAQHALVLGPGVGIGPQELAELCARRIRVRVRSRPSESARTGRASALEPLSAQPPPARVAPPYPSST